MAVFSLAATALKTGGSSLRGRLLQRDSPVAGRSPENPKCGNRNERLEERWEGIAEEVSQEADPKMKQR